MKKSLLFYCSVTGCSPLRKLQIGSMIYIRRTQRSWNPENGLH
jgi:hypothetical protein